MSDTLLGSIFALISAVAYSAMYFLVRAGVRRTDLDGGAFVTTVVNAILLVGGALVAAFLLPATPWSGEAIIWFALAGVLGTFGGRVTMLAGLRRIGPVRTASIVNTAPVVTITLSVLVLGEHLSDGALVAVALVLAGLGLLTLDAFGSTDPVLSAAARGDGPPPAGSPPERASGPSGAGTGALPAADSGPARTGLRDRKGSPAVVGLLFSAFSAASFGGARVTRRVGMNTMPDPIVGAMIAAVAALSSQLLMQAGQGRIRSVVIDAFRDVRPMLWLGGVASTIGLLTFFVAIRLAPLTHVAVIAASETIITMMMSWLLFRRQESLPPRVILAAISVFGAGVLVALS